MAIIWFSAAIGAGLTRKTDDAFGAALVATLAIGFGYWLLKDKL